MDSWRNIAISLMYLTKPSSPGDGQLKGQSYKGLNSNPHAIPLFQRCNDAPRKVLAFVLAAMSVKVDSLSPTTELNIHTAFGSAIAGELRRRPLIRIIYRVDTHWRLPPRVQRSSGVALEPEQKPRRKAQSHWQVPTGSYFALWTGLSL